MIALTTRATLFGTAKNIQRKVWHIFGSADCELQFTVPFHES
jgi:hypothetical protein